tara:strand:- start:1837 stop:2760 length:924 start_codon:yes stop_codon:yes gene_type:complete
MKKYPALLLFLFVATLSFSQSNFQDVVNLKNGSVIRGVIIEQIPNESITIETADRNVFVYQMAEIEKIAKEPYQENTTENYFNSFSSSGLQSGVRVIVELGHQFGTGSRLIEPYTDDYWEYLHLDNNTRTPPLNGSRFSIICGYQINPYFSLGVGTGIRQYKASGRNGEYRAALIPVFADFRVNFMDYKVSPYLSLGAGYSFDATRGFDGVGFLINPSIGVSVKVSEKSALNVGLGYEIQRIKCYVLYVYNENDYISAPVIGNYLDTYPSSNTPWFGPGSPRWVGDRSIYSHSMNVGMISLSAAISF